VQAAAKFISYLFHPLFIPTLSTGLILLTNPLEFRGLLIPPLQILLMAGMYTIFYPLITIVILKALKFIDSFEMPNRKERFIPFIATFVFFLWGFVVFKSDELGLPKILPASALGAAISVGLSFAFNVFEKISIHAVGMGGLTGLALWLMIYSPFDVKLILMLAVAISGLVCTARLVLKAHTMREIIVGFGLGFGCQLISIFLYIK